MSRPMPILATPTEAARKAFLQAAFAQGFTWSGTLNNIPEYIGGWAQYGAYVGNSSVLFWGDLDLDRYTLVNSSRHFINYVKRYHALKP